MSTQDGREQDALREDKPCVRPWSLGRHATIFGFSALVTVGLPALLHAPVPAEVFGLGAAVALAVKSPKLYAHLRQDLPEPLVAWLESRAHYECGSRTRERRPR